MGRLREKGLLKQVSVTISNFSIGDGFIRVAQNSSLKYSKDVRILQSYLQKIYTSKACTYTTFINTCIFYTS